MAIISLIGMSGAGKTYWSTQLAATGWKRICCDDLIEARLRTIMPLSTSGIQAVADWLKQPYDEGYQKRQQQYLDAEVSVMEEVLSNLTQQTDQHCVIDTTGSVIYTGDTICQQLRALTRVVYIALSENVMAQMVERYLSDPKPVLWIDQFTQLPEQTTQQAIATCYPKLVQQRAQRYQHYAHITLPYTTTSAPDFTLSNFLDAVLQHE
jgi:shikimate kinase